jgi:glycosyltransferase involved in cell wall biosynthesis
MEKPLKITYLFESTDLWGGTKVALEQAEALSEAGYRVTIFSKDSGPDWYPLKLPVVKETVFDADTIPESDIIIGTYWPTVKAAVESKKGMVVHFCQGYEGDYKEMSGSKAAIDEVYSYKIPKLVVSPHLDKFLKDRFNAETYYVGQMLDRSVFYPSVDRRERKELDPFNLLIVGPFEVDFKNIPVALKGIVRAKEKSALPIRLIRASQFPLSVEEERVIEPDVYLFHMPHQSMGDIYRDSDLFISMSKEAEGFGLPALEAMGCGVPAILSSISSYTSFDKLPDYALFVDSSDHIALSEAIGELFHNNMLREKLKQRGLAVAEKFTKEKVVARLKNAFEQIRYKDNLSNAKLWN